MKVNKICVIALGLMGDVLMRTPIIRELKTIYPKAKIHAIVDPIGLEILKNNPDVDHCFVMNRKKSPRFHYLKSKLLTQFYLIFQKFDLLVDLYGGKSSYNMARLSGAKYQIGIIKGKKWTNHRELLKYRNRSFNFDNHLHLTNQLFQMLGYLTPKIESDTKPIFYAKNDIGHADKYTLTHQHFIISLGSGGVEKILPLEKQAALVSHIYHQDGFIPAIIQNPQQEYLQETFISEHLIPLNIPFVKLDALPLSDIANIFCKVKFVIVPDTGLFHLSLAMSAPTFCIFTYTNPLLVQPTAKKYGYVFKETDMKDKVFDLALGTKDINTDYICERYNAFIYLLEY